MSSDTRVGNTSWHRTNNFNQYHGGEPLASKVASWVDNEGLCLLENEDGAMIFCHQDDVSRVEAELHHQADTCGVRQAFALALLYAGEWAFDSVYDGEEQGPESPYVQGCRETVGHLLACYLVQHGGHGGFGTAEARDLIDWEGPALTLQGWERLLEENELRKRKYRVAVTERRRLVFEVEALSAEEAEKLASGWPASSAILNEPLDDMVEVEDG